ncbi:uncharacterized protein LOC110443162 isoform X2 [Mizuhopecten yessoensis]|uniref:Uncharacterized protein n=1 Tax=Mizuhopecten yessoensis TaxID=6573 RepID=A0A210R0Q9_MIZYE|nr:uncharacterized protein LOC110443162 isoform X2 [Mizuhopecten yessoensis]OWF54589.1 hypothetical protein KP79_PYT11147 [Mizuhopecten yessoensis]
MMALKTTTHLSSTLPHVLKEYVPDYEPKHTAPAKLLTQSGLESPTKTDQSQGQQSSGDLSRQQSHRTTVHTRTASPSPTQYGRKKKQLSDAERHEHLSEKWDLAKSEVRHDQYEQLQEKIALQKELIQKQDIYAKQRRDQAERLQLQKKETEKAKKNAREAALEQKCKESLEEDRKASRSEKKKNVKSPANSDQPSGGHDLGKAKGAARSGGFQATLPPMSRTPSNFNLKEGKNKWQKPSQEELQWYQSQLYDMFGEDADTFLHPKMEQQVKVNPALGKQGGSTQKMDQILEDLSFEGLGRIGAAKLWETLRKESIMRLLREDANIPKELKETYSAFVRQSLGSQRRIVRRNFYAEDDVPELGRLQDDSMLTGVRHNKHKMDLMYRASVNNMDRTRILNHNNPLPDLAEGEDNCVGRYLPSWMDDTDSESIPEYTKWLQTTRGTATPRIDSAKKKDPWSREELDDELILLMSRKNKPSPKPKFVFMTEKDSRVRGQFADKFKEEREYKDIPRPYAGGHPEMKSKSVMGVLENSFTSSKRAESAPLPQKFINNYESFTTPWEPLSMNALMEYKARLDTEGEGEFNMGRTKVWKTEVKVS